MALRPVIMSGPIISGAPEFRDRHEAGRRLATMLVPLTPTHPVVLALPRGGVPVAFEVARRLHAPLGLLFARKIGMPGAEEFGLGAIAAEGKEHAEPVLDEALMRQVGITREALVPAIRHQRAEIARQQAEYGSATPPIDGRVVVVVDDGIATGGTMRAALRVVRHHGALRVVLAVPVAARETLADLAAECDDLVCLATPSDFRAVGIHYADFRQVEDSEVRTLLAQARTVP
ncbi:phosphoribosyltransferase [Komagataeibacter swingsii]|nr:phosphoribosyltransferase family protein [Komagataeibacter swingsii]